MWTCRKEFAGIGLTKGGYRKSQGSTIVATLIQDAASDDQTEEATILQVPNYFPDFTTFEFDFLDDRCWTSGIGEVTTFGVTTT